MAKAVKRYAVRQIAKIVFRMLNSGRFLSWYQTVFIPDCVEDNLPGSEEKAIAKLAEFFEQHSN